MYFNVIPFLIPTKGAWTNTFYLTAAADNQKQSAQAVTEPQAAAAQSQKEGGHMPLSTMWNMRHDTWIHTQH